MLNLDSFPAPACGQIRRAAVVFVLTLASALSFIACSTSLAQAQGAAAEEVATAESGETVYSLLVKGGFLMWPIGLCSIVVLMFAIERAVALRRLRTVPPELLDSLFEALPAREGSEDRHDEAISLLEGSRSILGDVLRTGVARLAAGAHATKIILEEAALKEAHRLHRKLRPFSVVETLAPLLGLLGTVYGMITCFENAVSVDTASRAQTLASGIYAALVTTAAGLTVAIPAKVLFHWFESRVDRVIDALEERLQAFLDFYFGEAELATATADDDVTAPARLAMAPASGDGARKAKRRERDELALGGIERTSEA